MKRRVAATVAAAVGRRAVGGHGSVERGKEGSKRKGRGSRNAAIVVFFFLGGGGKE